MAEIAELEAYFPLQRDRQYINITHRGYQIYTVEEN